MPRQSELFPTRAPVERRPHAAAPLAERMRPRTVDEFVGQRHLLGSGRLLSDLLAAGRVESLILWGPPGTGKTTLAHLLAAAAGGPTAKFSAVLHGVKELRLRRIVAITMPSNAASVRVLERIGMRFERHVTLPGDDERLALYAIEPS